MLCGQINIDVEKLPIKHPRNRGCIGSIGPDFILHKRFVKLLLSFSLNMLIIFAASGNTQPKLASSPKFWIKRMDELDGGDSEIFQVISNIGKFCLRKSPKNIWDGLQGYGKAAQHAVIFPQAGDSNLNPECLKNLYNHLSNENQPPPQGFIDETCSVITSIIYFHNRHKEIVKNKKGVEVLVDKENDETIPGTFENAQFAPRRHTEIVLMEKVNEGNVFNNFIVKVCYPNADEFEKNIAKGDVNRATIYLYTQLEPCSNCKQAIENFATLRSGSTKVAYTKNLAQQLPN